MILLIIFGFRFAFQSRRAGDRDSDVILKLPLTGRKPPKRFNPDERAKGIPTLVPKNQPGEQLVFCFNPDVREIIRATGAVVCIKCPECKVWVQFQSRRAGDHSCDLDAWKVIEVTDAAMSFQSRRAGDHSCDVDPTATAPAPVEPTASFNPDVREIIRATQRQTAAVRPLHCSFNPDVRETIRATFQDGSNWRACQKCQGFQSRRAGDRPCDGDA